MKQGDILYAKSLSMIGSGSTLDGVNYNPWVYGGLGGINSMIDFLAKEDVTPTGLQIPKFIGGATNPPERKKNLQWGFGDPVGVYVGKTKYLSGVAYLKVTVQLRAYIGSGDDYPIDAQVWVRSSDVTNDQSELEALVDDGKSGGLSKSDLKDKMKGATGDNKGGGNNDQKNNTILYVVIGLAVAIAGFFLLRKK